MAALTKERATPVRDGRVIRGHVGASTTIHAGGVIELAATGQVSAASAGGSKTYWGLALESVKTGVGETATIEIQHGAVVHMLTDASLDTDAEKLAAIGGEVHLVDDQTVSTVSGGRSACGRVVDFDDDGVWVKLPY